MTTQIRAWRNIYPAATQSLAVTATSQTINLVATTPGVCALRIANIGTDVIFIEPVESLASTTTAASGIPMLPNTVEVFTFANDKVGLAVISAGTGSTVYVTPGEGL